MSLVRIYRLGCEGPYLARLLAAPFSYAGHEPFSGMEQSSEKARRAAIRAGWSRITKRRPIFADQPDGPATDIKFDLCPSCSAQLRDVN